MGSVPQPIKSPSRFEDQHQANSRDHKVQRFFITGSISQQCPLDPKPFEQPFALNEHVPENDDGDDDQNDIENLRWQSVGPTIDQRATEKNEYQPQQPKQCQVGLLVKKVEVNCSHDEHRQQDCQRVVDVFFGLAETIRHVIQSFTLNWNNAAERQAMVWLKSSTWAARNHMRKKSIPSFRRARFPLRIELDRTGMKWNSGITNRIFGIERFPRRVFFGNLRPRFS